jgi:hypothetical protein
MPTRCEVGREDTTSLSFPVAFQYPASVARLVRIPVGYLRSFRLKKYHSFSPIVDFSARQKATKLHLHIVFVRIGTTSMRTFKRFHSAIARDVFTTFIVIQVMLMNSCNRVDLEGCRMSCRDLLLNCKKWLTLCREKGSELEIRSS